MPGPIPWVAVFLQDMERIYLDNAATTALDPLVLEAMMPFLTEHYGNPSSIHAYGRRTRAAIENARRSVANLLNCTPGEIIFTSCGTEADNMALRCAVRDLGVRNIISSPIEHHAVEYTVQNLDASGAAKAHMVRLGPDGQVDMAHLEELLRTLPNALVSLMHANNEIGTRIDLHAVGNLCRAHNALFHSDTVQTMCHYRFDMATLPVDFLVASAHKFHGPKGIGFLFMRSGIGLKPMLQGGSQERNMRGGTENLYGIIGMARAMELAFEDLEGHQRHVQGLKDHMKARLVASIPGVSFNGDTGPDSLYTVLSVRFPENGRGEMLLYNLDIEGIAVSGGSACSSGSSTGSHVMAALYPGVTATNVRFSFSRFTTKAEVDRTIEALERIFAVVPSPAKKAVV